jgi:hypothetical protein
MEQNKSVSIDEEDISRVVYDSDGKFNSEKMEEQFQRLKKKVKKHLVLEEIDMREDELENLSEDIVKVLLKSVIKETKNSDIRVWFWWREHKHIIYALGLGLFFAIIMNVLS